MTTTDLPRADGDAGARRAGAFMGIAACADVSTTSLGEDSAKVDLKLSFRHAFRPGKLITLHAQIKSGRSYRLRSSTAKEIALGIDKPTLDALRGSGEPGLIVWVPPAPLDRLYWHATDPRRPIKATTKISRTQYVRPSIRYDLTRLIEYAGWNTSISRQTVGVLPTAGLMSKAKAAYTTLRATSWVHPLVGTLKVSRLAWRHVTKNSRGATDRVLRLRAVPYLKNFLAKHPERYVCNPGTIEVFGSETRETRYILCWYRGALVIDGQPHSLLLRIKEEIKYPTDWASRTLATRDITQSATLASWWCKKEK